MAVLAMVNSEDLKPIDCSKEHAPVATKRVIVGRDNGKPVLKPQKRNDKCVCGSGRKAKNCCVYFPKESYRIKSFVEVDSETGDSLYWSNENGWVDKESSDKYHSKELVKFLPKDSEWVTDVSLV